MATNAHTTGAQTRASSFPDLDPLEDVPAILQSVSGALGILAHALEDQDRHGTDAASAAYTAAYAIDFAKQKVSATIAALFDYRVAQGAR